MPLTDEVPACVDDLDVGWLTRALGLGPVASVVATPVGMGNVATTVRLDLTWEAPALGPRTLVAKVAASDPDQRGAAIAWRAYEVEATFYASLAPQISARLPRCYWAGFDASTERYAVLLEDLGSLRVGDELAGCSPDDAAAALAELALVHAPRWGDPALATLSWLNRYPQGTAGQLGGELAACLPRFLDRHAEGVSGEVVGQITRFVESADLYDRNGVDGPRTVAHCDFRSDNLVFGADRVCILDWQTVKLGSGFADVSYFLGGALRTEDRRRFERDLVQEYHGRLRAQGVDLAWERCWTEYRRHSFSLLTTVLKVARSLEVSARGGAVLQTLAERAAWQALDLESEAMLQKQRS